MLNCYEYYSKKSKKVVLSHEGIELLRNQLERYRCKICNNLTILITKEEGSFIVCSSQIFNHKTGYYIDMSNLKIEPFIKEKK